MYALMNKKNHIKTKGKLTKESFRGNYNITLKLPCLFLFEKLQVVLPRKIGKELFSFTIYSASLKNETWTCYKSSSKPEISGQMRTLIKRG